MADITIDITPDDFPAGTFRDAAKLAEAGDGWGALMLIIKRHGGSKDRPHVPALSTLVANSRIRRNSEVE